MYSVQFIVKGFDIFVYSLLYFCFFVKFVCKALMIDSYCDNMPHYCCCIPLQSMKFTVYVFLGNNGGIGSIY